MDQGAERFLKMSSKLCVCFFHTHFDMLFWYYCWSLKQQYSMQWLGKYLVSHSICLVCFIHLFYKHLSIYHLLFIMTTDFSMFPVTKNLAVHCRRPTFTKCSCSWEGKFGLPECVKESFLEEVILEMILEKEAGIFQVRKGERRKYSRYRKPHFQYSFPKPTLLYPIISKCLVIY